ncbi:MAG TPA: chemotaxis protein CheW [Vicinamibacterales bacterium]|nr:chemotaxis protein CheW [Vicinamibacterales bacterium]
MNPDETERPAPSDPIPADAGVSYLGVYVGPELYGVPLMRLREVARLTRLRRVPGVAANVAGLVNLRGEIVCALDAHGILGLPRASGTTPGYLLALHDFGFPVGLVVDAIGDIFRVDPNVLDDVPSSWRAERMACLTGVCRVQESVAGLLDLDRVVRR